MIVLNRFVKRSKLNLIILFVINCSVAAAQNVNLMMLSPEPTVEFMDLKKFGVKENYDKPNSYDNKEFKPHSSISNASSVKYEFVEFKSASQSSLEIESMEGGLIFLDRQSFKNMGLSIIKGDPNAVFNSDFNILISDKIARAYFGDEEPLDKILILNGKYSVMIKGVYKSKGNSLPLEFDLIAGPVTNEKINQR